MPAQKKGMQTKGQPRAWTPEEDISLKEMCEQGLSRAEIAEKLDRSPRAIEHRINKNGLSKEQPRPWSPEENDRLKEMYISGINRKEIATELDRSLESVEHKIKLNGLAKDQPQPWSPKEDALLGELHGNGTAIKKIAEILGRTLDSVQHRIIKNGLSKERALPWRLEEDVMLIKMLEAGATHEEVALKLGRSIDSVVHRKGKLFKKLGCQAKLPLKNGAWTPEEENLLEKMYAEGATSAEIAARLGRSIMAVEGKKRRMDLTVSGDLIPIPEEIKKDEMELRNWLWENRIKPVLVENNGCLEWRNKSVGKGGYGSLIAVGKHFRAHRVALEVKIGKVLNYETKSLHDCDNPKCCNPEHLRPGTTIDNSADRVLRGRQARGEKSGAAKMTEDMVRLARFLFEPGVTTYKELAHEFNIALGTMYHIIKRNTWAHI